MCVFVCTLWYILNLYWFKQYQRFSSTHRLPLSNFCHIRHVKSSLNRRCLIVQPIWVRPSVFDRLKKNSTILFSFTCNFPVSIYCRFFMCAFHLLVLIKSKCTSCTITTDKNQLAACTWHSTGHLAVHPATWPLSYFLWCVCPNCVWIL